jgi:hypothetical protein
MPTQKPSNDLADGEVSNDLSDGEVKSAAPAPTESGPMRAYHAVGDEIKAPFQSAADILSKANKALGKGGPKELVRQLKSGEIGDPPTGSVGGALKAAAGSVNPIAVKRAPDGSVDIPATIGGTVGRVGLMLGFPEVREGAGDAASAVGEKATETPRNMARSLTHSGERETGKLVADTIKANQAAEKAATETNATKQETFQTRKAVYDAKVSDLTQKHEAATAKHQQATADYEAAKTHAEELKKAAAETKTTRGQMARQVQETGARLVNRVKQAQQRAKANIDARWENLRENMKGASVPREQLADLVRNAEAKLSGSSENIKVFRDILSKSEEGGEDVVVSGGAKFGPGTPLYESVKNSPSGLPDASAPASFADLQGYYSELGEKLSSGSLPGDVYQAIKSLQEGIGSAMQRLAASRGQGAALTSARAAYRDYMQAFREPTGPQHSGSPLAQVLDAADPAHAIKPLTDLTTAARVRNMLAQYDPGAAPGGGGAVLYDNFLKASRAYDALPKPEAMAKAIKEPKPLGPAPVGPKLPAPPKAPKTVVPEIKRIGTEELQQSKRQNIQSEADTIRKFGSWVIPLTIVHALTGVLTLDAKLALSAIADVPVYLASREAIAGALEKPKVVEWISKPSPKDIEALMKLPPEYRGKIQSSVGQVVRQAQQRGISVSPAVAAFVGSSTAAPPAPRDTRHPSDIWSDPAQLSR